MQTTPIRPTEVQCSRCITRLFIYFNFLKIYFIFFSKHFSFFLKMYFFVQGAGERAVQAEGGGGQEVDGR